MERAVFCRVGGWLLRLDACLDEETWPDWLRKVLSIAAVVFIFCSFGLLWWVTP